MTKEEYANFLKSPEWETISEKRKKMDDHECQCCGNTRNLVVHHTDYLKGDKGLLDLDHLVTLCYRCHSIIHGKWNFDEEKPTDRRDLDKKVPPVEEMFRAEEGKLLVAINDFCQKRSFDEAGSENRFWPNEVDFMKGPMRDVFNRWLETERNGLLKNNTLELLTYDVQVYVQNTSGSWLSVPAWFVLKKIGDKVNDENSVESGSEEQMKGIVKLIIDSRLKTYTRLKDVVARRLDELPEGEERRSTEDLLRQYLSYISTLKQAKRIG